LRETVVGHLSSSVAALCECRTIFRPTVIDRRYNQNLAGSVVSRLFG